MAQMLDYIRENFNHNITLSDIAESFGISDWEALCCSKRAIAESPIQYLVEHRLMRSADMLLAQSAESISAITGNCGFDSPAYYTKRFIELAIRIAIADISHILQVGPVHPNQEIVSVVVGIDELSGRFSSAVDPKLGQLAAGRRLDV